MPYVAVVLGTVTVYALAGPSRGLRLLEDPGPDLLDGGHVLRIDGRRGGCRGRLASGDRDGRRPGHEGESDERRETCSHGYETFVRPGMGRPGASNFAFISSDGGNRLTFEFIAWSHVSSWPE